MSGIRFVQRRDELPLVLFSLHGDQLGRSVWAGPPAWVPPLFREEMFKDKDNGDQKSHRTTDQNQGSHGPCERCTAHSEHARKFPPSDMILASPQLRTEVPLSSTEGDDGEEEGSHVGTLENVTQLGRNGAHGKNWQGGEGTSDQTDPDGSVGGKGRESWNTETLEEDVSGVEET